MKRVLILGGTADAAALAVKAAKISGIEVITSLAGRTRQPSNVAGTLRVGGFGGGSGLVDYLREQQIDRLVDATHPFAAQMSWHAAAAAIEVGIPHLMLVRPAWQKVAGDAWIEVEDVAAAAQVFSQAEHVQATHSQAKRIFLTIGRQQLAAFAALIEPWFLIRSIDPPDITFPHCKILLDRGPFSLEAERRLLREERIEAIVSKNSGGDATYAKVAAARELKIPIVMVQRPPMPAVEQVADADRAIAWLRDRP